MTQRINRSGTSGIGYYATGSYTGEYLGFGTGYTARSVYFLSPSVTRRPVFYFGNSKTVSESLNFDSFDQNYWLDVGTDKVFGITKSTFATIPEFDTDIAVAVFNKNFVQIDERQISIYKADQMPTTEGDPRILHWVSYSED
jgi:hypothetical protein